MDSIRLKYINKLMISHLYYIEGCYSCKIFISQFTYSANVRNTRKEGSYCPGNGEQFKTSFYTKIVCFED